MKIVIDCNVIISAGLTKGTCRQVLLSVLDNHTLIVSEPILEEWACVIQREKFSAHRPYLETLLLSLCQLGTLVKPTSQPFLLPDKDDEKYLEAAQAGNATILITGNKKHFPESLYGETRIMAPAEYHVQYVEP